MPLSRIAERKWRQPCLMLASDGVWDLWNYNEVARVRLRLRLRLRVRVQG